MSNKENDFSRYLYWAFLFIIFALVAPFIFTKYSTSVYFNETTEQIGDTIGVLGGPIGIAVGGLVGGAIGGIAGSGLGKSIANWF